MSVNVVRLWVPIVVVIEAAWLVAIGWYAVKGLVAL